MSPTFLATEIVTGTLVLKSALFQSSFVSAIISFPFNEEKNINVKFDQGDIVVEDLTSDYEIGTPLSARNSFFPMMRRSVKEVLNEADGILLAGGKPFCMP